MSVNSRRGTRSYSTCSSELDEARKTLDIAINSYEPSGEFSREEFQQVANGVFQAEGCVSARIRKGLSVSPVVVLGQNYSKESVEFFASCTYFKYSRKL